MDLITLAIPVFVLMIALELGYGLINGQNNYRLNDTVNSLSMGSLSTVGKLVFFDASIYLFDWLASVLEVIRWSDHWLVWIFAFVAYDFLYYWFHRISHERNLFWASHVAHHQSEEYNLSTALRQTGTGFLCSWVFYIPLFLIGCPPDMFYTVAALNLLYQFWVHTEHVGKLGWYEKLFVTPSNHRVHHARNDRYIDRNYGGVFIVWDRWFGTFCEESDREPCRYGISQPLRSWNPLWANLHVYAAMVQAAASQSSWRDKLAVMLWSPSQLKIMLDTTEKFHQAAPRASEQKFDPPLTRAAQWYVGIQFALIVCLVSFVSVQAGQLAWPLLWLAFVFCLLSCIAFGLLMENRALGYYLELARFAAVFGIISLLGTELVGLSTDALIGIAVVTLVSSASVVLLMRTQGLRKAVSPS